MTNKLKTNIIFALFFMTVICCRSVDNSLPDPKNNPDSPIMLQNDWAPDNPQDIEHDGSLLISLSGGKQSVNALKMDIKEPNL